MPRSKFSIQLTQNQPKSHILFHKNGSQQDFYNLYIFLTKAKEWPREVTVLIYIVVQELVLKSRVFAMIALFSDSLSIYSRLQSFQIRFLKLGIQKVLQAMQILFSANILTYFFNWGCQFILIHLKLE